MCHVFCLLFSLLHIKARADHLVERDLAGDHVLLSAWKLCFLSESENVKTVCVGELTPGLRPGLLFCRPFRGFRTRRVGSHPMLPGYNNA